ncbi:hypothetical protein J8M20_08040 [Pseudoalteromonas luteoviolacea]|nr:hypothetical protein [Pseudoalteromonas luteoviolacea]MBQ4811283.1 hypothetical protein [Pseudoalteromonas luteoviolacea]
MSNIKSIKNTNYLLLQKKYLKTISGGRDGGAVIVTKKANAQIPDTIKKG